MTRRWARRLAVLLCLAVVATACGGDDDGGGDGDEAEVDPNGVVRWGVDLEANGGWCFDPATSMKSNQFFLNYAVFDGLLRQNRDGEYEPALAEKAEIVDNMTIEVTLREGLKFSDGSPLDANALKATIDRNRQSRNAAALDPAQLGLISDVVVESPTTVVIKFSRPNATLFYPLLAKLDTAPMSPQAVAAGADLCRQPVAAGPFRITAFTPVRVTMEKNPNYYDADAVRLAGLEMVHVTPEAAATALPAGDIDIMSVGRDVAAGFTGPLVADSTPAVGNIQMNLCLQGKPPLDNVKFRQALNYAVDREAINEVVFGGDSEPAWGLWPSFHPYYNEDLEGHYEHDPAKARQLLAEAGYPNGASFDVIVPTNVNARRVIEIAQQQWAEVGIRANLVPSANPNNDFFIDVRIPANVYSNARGGVDKISISHLSTSFANVCKLPVPQLDAIIAEIGALGPDDQDRVPELVQRATEIIVKDIAWNVNFVFDVETWAYNEDRIGDLDYHLNAIALRHPLWRDMFIKR